MFFGKTICFGGFSEGVSVISNNIMFKVWEQFKDLNSDQIQFDNLTLGNNGSTKKLSLFCVRAFTETNLSEISFYEKQLYVNVLLIFVFLCHFRILN